MFICDLIRVRLTCDDRNCTAALVRLNWFCKFYRSIAYSDTDEWGHTQKNPFRSNRNTILCEWLSACVSTFCPLRHTNIEISFGRLPLLQSLETIWQLHRKICICMCVSFRAKRRQKKQKIMLMQPIFGLFNFINAPNCVYAFLHFSSANFHLLKQFWMVFIHRHCALGTPLMLIEKQKKKRKK